MAFDFGAASDRIGKEFDSLVNALWPNLPESERSGAASVEDKATIMRGHMDFKSEREMAFNENKFCMLYYLSDGRYWNAVDNWRELQSNPAFFGDAEFYAKFMIELAKKDRDEAKGRVWIVERYDDHVLKPYIDEELLATSVNKGFWGMAEAHFSKPPRTDFAPPMESSYFRTLSKHMQLLDLTDTSFFPKGQLVCKECWPDANYDLAFDRAVEKHKLSLDEEAFLVRPIIEHRICSAYAIISPVRDPEGFLKRRLKPYERYLKTSTIQTLLEEKMASVLEAIAKADSGNDFELGVFRTGKLRVLAQLRFSPERALDERASDKSASDELKGFISRNLQMRDGLAVALVNSDIPSNLFDEKTLKALESQLVSSACAMLKNSPRDPTGYLSFARKSSELGFTSKETAEKQYKTGFEAYLAITPRPTLQTAVAFRNAMRTLVIGESLEEIKTDVAAAIQRDVGLRSRTPNAAAKTERPVGSKKIIA